MKKVVILFIVLMFVLSVVIGHCDEINTGATEDVKVEAPAGVEVPAHEEGETSQLLVRKAYTASYNKETRCPNWVAWELTAERGRYDGAKEHVS